ncbi:MAG: hypothetical protein WEB63_02835 [Cucumibacter sp.]
MTKMMGRLALLGLAAFAFTLAPLVMNLPVPGEAVAMAKNTKQPAAGNNGNGGNSAAAHARHSQTASAEGVFVPPGQEGEKNIHALLGGLNSLGRNINGLMNSADSRMETFRAFVEANANYDLALEALEEATALLGTADTAYRALVAGLLTAIALDPAVYPDLYVPTLQARYDELAALGLILGDPGYEEMIGLAAVLGQVQTSQELLDLQDAQTAFGTAEADALAASVGTGEDALVAALLEGANPNRSYTDEEMARMVAWANEVLGVGDFDGTIDELLALWASEAAADVAAPI